MERLLWCSSEKSPGQDPFWEKRKQKQRRPALPSCWMCGRSLQVPQVGPCDGVCKPERTLSREAGWCLATAATTW